MPDRNDLVFYGVLLTGLLAVLLLDHRLLNSREISPLVPSENVNENPNGLAPTDLMPLRDANIPLARPDFGAIPNVGNLVS